MRLLDVLNVETASSADNLLKIIENAPRRYKVYNIPKRNGGFRTIAHPARELKALQRIVLREILEPLPISSVATAYVKGRGILKNAETHAMNRWILKLDFSNFFPSIIPADWDNFVRSEPRLEKFKSDRSLFHKLIFWGQKTSTPRCLSIGAPTSPAVSNLVCRKLDQFMTELAAEVGVAVTRYADDITVSANLPTKLLRFESELSLFLKRQRRPNFQLNMEKRGMYGPGQRKMVTGLIITPDGKVSLGRDRKREITTLVHKSIIIQNPPELLLKTRGLLAFAHAVEPSFITSLEKKYGREIINSIKTGWQPTDNPYNWE